MQNINQGDFTGEEIKYVINRLNNDKAAGLDGIPGELPKNWCQTTIIIKCQKGKSSSV